MASRLRKIGISTIGACAGATIAAWALNSNNNHTVQTASIAKPRVKRQLPPRSEQLQVLQSGEEYDVLGKKFCFFFFCGQKLLTIFQNSKNVYQQLLVVVQQELDAL